MNICCFIESFWREQRTKKCLNMFSQSNFSGKKKDSILSFSLCVIFSLDLNHWKKEKGE